MTHMVMTTVIKSELFKNFHSRLFLRRVGTVLTEEVAHARSWLFLNWDLNVIQPNR